jgi:hypothetical protein
MSNNPERRGYHIIEPPIYNDLDWDMDLIVACLDVLRSKLPGRFVQFPPGSQFYLIALTKFLDQSYPVIGVYHPDDAESRKIPGFLDLYDTVEKAVQELGLEAIAKEAVRGRPLSWLELQKIGVYLGE